MSTVQRKLHTNYKDWQRTCLPENWDFYTLVVKHYGHNVNLAANASGISEGCYWGVLEGTMDPSVNLRKMVTDLITKHGGESTTKEEHMSDVDFSSVDSGEIATKKYKTKPGRQKNTMSSESVKELMAVTHWNIAEAASHIGCSKQTVANVLTDGLCSVQIDNSAKYLLSKYAKPSGEDRKTNLWLVHVPADQVLIVDSVLTALKVKITAVNTD